MFSLRVASIAFCVFLLSFLSQNVFAAGSGAYRVEAPDAGAFGMGSAFVGEADTPAAVYYNPAGINQMSRPEISLGDSIVAPRAQYKTSSGDTLSERNHEYNIPNFYAVIPVKSNKFTLGFGSGSYWGLGTDWAPDSSLRYATTQANITNVDNSLVAAFQVTSQWSLAASVENDYSKADESYKFPNPSQADGGLELKATDDSWGYRLATLFRFNDKNQAGLMYRSRINHNYVGNVYADNIGAYYQGALSGIPGPALGSSFQTKAEEKAVLPQSVVMGYSFKPITKLTINADLEWMDWSSTKYQTLTFPNATPQQSAFLGLSPNPITQNWHSAWSESVGAQYAVTDQFRVRAGYYHHQSPIPSNTFNPVIPDSSSNAFTVGFGYDLTKRLSIDLAYSGLVYRARDITNTVSNVFTGTVNGKYSQYVHIGALSLTYKF